MVLFHLITAAEKLLLLQAENTMDYFNTTAFQQVKAAPTSWAALQREIENTNEAPELDTALCLTSSV